MPALTDLIVPLTVAQVQATQMSIMQLAGMPVTSWQVGSVPLTLLQADAQTLSDLSNTIALTAQGGLISLAAGPWLDLIAQGHYGLTRKPAVATVGNVTLTDSSGGGPYTIVAQQLYVGPSSGKYRFQNTTGGTLPKNGTLVVSVTAEAVGAAYNLANGAINALLTPLPGVTVSNPDAGLGTGSWTTTLGTDAESDASLKLRCSQRWPGLGGGATKGVYQFWAVTSTPTVTRVNVLEAYPTGGQVTIYCAGSTGASSATDVASVAAYIAPLRPLCVTVNTFAATPRTVPLNATVTVTNASLSAAQTTFLANLASYSAALAIGGTIYVAKLIDLFMSIPGVVNVQVTSPAVDTTLNSQEVAVFAQSLNWVGV